MTGKMKKTVIIVFAAFCALVMGLVTGLTVKQGRESRDLLEDSIKSQLSSIATAAVNLIDADAFIQYDDFYDTHGDDEYNATLTSLRKLANDVGADYIYALKKVGDQYLLIFDIDTINNEAFEPYELSDVHIQAMTSRQLVVGIMNMQDETGSFNTAAIPVMKDGAVVGVLGADIRDTLIAESIREYKINIAVMVSGVAIVLLSFALLAYFLFSKIEKMQKQLERMANIDRLTNLPNRRYLLEHLEEITTRRDKRPFALYFIDLDNFKKVNDNAGHDAGDALLQHVGAYLQGVQKNSKVFRPGAGTLNVTARVGGDEFILIAPDINTVKDADMFAKEIVEGFHTNITDKHIEKYSVGLSIGVAIFPADSTNFHVLIKYADIAMYHAKRSGKNGYRVYNEEMGQKEEK